MSKQLVILVVAFLVAAPTEKGFADTRKPLQGLPPVADNQIFSGDWGHWDEAGKRFTAVLQRTFPLGSSEKKMVQSLIKQGFKYRPRGKPGCVNDRDHSKIPVGTSYVPCPAYDPDHVLAYDWQPLEFGLSIRLACSQTLAVWWDAKDDKILSVRGFFDGQCP